MTSHERRRNQQSEPELVDGDVTSPADDDVVAQIRAQAAKIRSDNVVTGPADLVPLTVWTPEDSAEDAADVVVPDDPVDEDPVDDGVADDPAALDRPVDDNPVDDDPVDDTAHSTSAPEFARDGFKNSITARELGEPRRQLLPHDDTVAFTTSSPVPRALTSAPTATSLIEGLAPPESAIVFWADQPSPSTGVDTPSRLHRSPAVSLWVWIALITVLIVLASVGIAIAVAAIGWPT